MKSNMANTIDQPKWHSFCRPPIRDSVEGLAHEVRRYLAGRGATLEQFDLSLSMSTGPGLRAGLRVEVSGCDKATATDFPVYMRDLGWPITSNTFVGGSLSAFFRLEVRP